MANHGYFDSRQYVNTLNDMILAKDMEDTTTVLVKISSIIQQMINAIESQNERIERLEDTLYLIAPELEIIETLADSEDEKWKMVETYMNHNDVYA